MNDDKNKVTRIYEDDFEIKKLPAFIKASSFVVSGIILFSVALWIMIYASREIGRIISEVP